MDFTPGIFDLLIERRPGGRRRPEEPRIRTTLAKQLALYVVLYSPLQMAADLPENYEGQPAFQFIRDVAVDWDTTRVLDGRIGDYVAVARRERGGQTWFVGAITDEEGRTLDLPLSFLTPGRRYVAEIYADGPKAHWLDNPLPVTITQTPGDLRDQAARHAGARRRPGDPDPAGEVTDELKALRSLARAMGVHTRYINGLGKAVTVAPETLVRVCAALGAPIERPGDAAGALRAQRETTDARSCRRCWSPGTALFPSRSPPTARSRHGCSSRTERSSRCCVRSRVSDGRAASLRVPPAHRRGRGPERDEHGHRRPARGMAPARGASELGGRDPSGRTPLGAESIARRSSGPRVTLPLGR